MSGNELDEGLIIRMGAGDAGAFQEIYLATSHIVFGYALSILKNRSDAEDVMHDAFIRAYQGATCYQALGKPLSWLLAIVRNLCFSKLRADKPTVDLGDCSELAYPGEEQDSIDRIVLQKALDTLSAQECQIVVLHALTGLKHREIAQVMGMPTGTVLSKYHRALKRLRTQLEGEGGST